jgi:ATP-binding cassette subfamily B protein
MSENKDKNKFKRVRIIKKVLRHIEKYLPFLAVSIILSGVSAVLALYIPILVGDAVDLIAGPGNVDFSRITVILLRIGICAAGAGFAQWIMNIVNNRITYHVVRDVRREAFVRIESLPFSYIDSHPAGELVSRVINDADQFSDGLLLGFTQLFTGIVTIVGTLVFMLTINPGITLVVVVLTPVSLFAARFIAVRTYNLFRRQSEIRGEETAYVSELIKNQKVVRAFSQEAKTLEKFGEINEKYRKSSLSAIFYSSLTNPVTRFVNSLVYTGVAFAGAFAAVLGSITVGGLASFLAYANQYTKPFNEISGVVAELQNALACAGRLFELIDELPEESDVGKLALPAPVSGRVSLENISFSYRPDRPLIENLSLNVCPGQRVAIVGPSGCGKTTLINLLMRFYDVNSGAVKVEGEDIREVTRHSLRTNFGMVLQDTWLKSGTIRENLIMGKPDATDEEIIAAAVASHAHSFIRRLPDGYDTVIGEDGGSLSEGQKQLLCITRVMLRRPPMLILDEATSSIDTRTERKIQEAISSLMEGRTSFIVAHRLSTIQDADIILVMRDGQIVERGKHEELLARGGFYSELYSSQFAHK